MVILLFYTSVKIDAKVSDLVLVTGATDKSQSRRHPIKAKREPQ
jgi:hypothetical protein